MLSSELFPSFSFPTPWKGLVRALSTRGVQEKLFESRSCWLVRLLFFLNIYSCIYLIVICTSRLVWMKYSTAKLKYWAHMERAIERYSVVCYFIRLTHWVKNQVGLMNDKSKTQWGLWHPWSSFNLLWAWRLAKGCACLSDTISLLWALTNRKAHDHQARFHSFWIRENLVFLLRCTWDSSTVHFSETVGVEKTTFWRIQAEVSILNCLQRERCATETKKKSITVNIGPWRFFFFLFQMSRRS